MTEIKNIFLNKEIRCGGFYELSIQVCPSSEMEPIEKYSNYIKSLEYVDGPFDDNFELTELNIENYEHQWVLNLKNLSVPFKTFNIRETEPIETGFNWFDISFYTATIKELFGQEYQSGTENSKYPKELIEFFNNTMLELNKVHKFLLAMIDFEISGEYYLADLGTEFENWTNSRFFVNQKNASLITEQIKNKVTIITEK